LNALIKVEGVSKAYIKYGTNQEHVVLRDINLEVADGEFVCLLGPSGCGKTTLLKVMDGMIAPDRGRVILAGKPISEALGEVGFVFQDVGLLSWRNVLQNVWLGLEARGVPKAERTRLAMESIKLVGLEQFSNYFPYQLSGGMQQRVGLARALSITPKVLLMDEPFGSVDAMTRGTLQKELSRIWEGNRVTVVFVTHDVNEAMFLADRIIVMGQAQILRSVDVKLPRPRGKTDTRSDKRYVELWTDLISVLDGAHAGMGGGQ